VTVVVRGTDVHVDLSAKAAGPHDVARPLLPRDPAPLPEDGIEDMDHLTQLHE